MDNDQKAEIEHAEAIVYTLTEQDVVDANKLNFLATYRKARTYRAWLVVMFIYFTLAVSTTSDHRPAALLVDAAIAVGGVVLLLLICALIGFALLPRRAKRAFRQHKALHREQHVLIRPDAITFDMLNVHVRQPWDELARWNENRKLLLLYPADRLFHVLPDRVLTETLRSEIRQNLIAASVPKDR